MNRRPLGKTGLSVSEIGFGTWGIGGTANQAVAYGPTDDRESVRALERALEMGVNFYETADLYGHGHSERLLGRAFAGVRSKVLIASKAGRTDAEGGQDFTGPHLRRSLEGTLGRLQTDYVDLYQLHDPPLDRLEREGALRTLEDLKKEGKVRAFGLSARSPEEAAEAVRKFGFLSIQVNFNMLDQRAAESGLFELCAERGAGVIARTPLCFGFLTGAYPAGTSFQEGDHRKRWSQEQRELWAQAYRGFLEASAAPGQTPVQMALRFCLSYPQISSAIPGMLTEQHVEENVSASRMGPLGPEERGRMEEIYKNGRFFLGQAATTVTGKSVVSN